MRVFFRSVALALAALLITVVVFGYGSQASGPQVDLPTVLTTVSVGGGGSGDGPEGVGVDTVTNRIFVANSLDNAIYVVNGATNGVVATITDGRINRPQGVAVNTVSRKAYVANWGNRSVLVLNADTMTIITEITGMGPGPTDIAIDTAANMVYVTNFADASEEGQSVSIINGATDTLSTTVVLAIDGAGQRFPFGIALDTAQHRAYITHRWGQCGMYITVLDTATLEVSRYDGYLMCNPAGIIVRPAASSVFVAQRYNGENNPTLAIFDYTGGNYHNLVARWFIGLPLTLDGTNYFGNPVGVAYNPATERVFINSYNQSVVVVADAVNLTILAAVPVGTNPDLGVAVNPLTSRVYVANRASGTLTVLQDGALEPTATPTSTATPTPTVTPTPPPCAVDPYEPDDLPAQAHAIITAFGYTQTHSFCGPVPLPWEVDEDFVTFRASAGAILTMTTSNLTNGADTYLTLYGPDVATNETKLAEDDDGGGGLTSRLTHAFTQTAAYFLRVNNVGAVATAAKLKAMGITPSAPAIPQRNYDLGIAGGPPLNERAFLPVVIRQ